MDGGGARSYLVKLLGVKRKRLKSDNNCETEFKKLHNEINWKSGLVASAIVMSSVLNSLSPLAGSSFRSYGEVSKNNGYYEVYDADQLREIAEMVNNRENDSESYNIRLMNDIDLNPGKTVNNDKLKNAGDEFKNSLNSWAVMGTYDKPYKWEFDGQGYAIKGMYIKDTIAIDNKTVLGIGMIGYGDGAKIKNLKLELSGGVEIQMTNNTGWWTNTVSIGGLMGSGKNVEISDCVTIGDFDLSLSNIQEAGMMTGHSYYFGGIIGDVSEGSIINKCVNNGAVKQNRGGTVGGIVGCANNSEIKNCANLGNVTGNFVGGIVGKGINAKINYCGNQGDLANAKGAGGILALVDGANTTTEVRGCFNNGFVSGWADTRNSDNGFGGIIGVILKNSASIKVNVSECKNSGRIHTFSTGAHGSSGYPGGIIGMVGYNKDSVIKIVDCVNAATVSTDSYYAGSGGIIGYAYYDVEINNCNNSGVITGPRAGGIVGHNEFKLNMINCVNNSLDLPLVKYNTGQATVNNCYQKKSAGGWEDYQYEKAVNVAGTDSKQRFSGEALVVELNQVVSNKNTEDGIAENEKLVKWIRRSNNAEVYLSDKLEIRVKVNNGTEYLEAVKRNLENGNVLNARNGLELYRTVDSEEYLINNGYYTMRVDGVDGDNVVYIIECLRDAGAFKDESKIVNYKMNFNDLILTYDDYNRGFMLKS